MPRRYQSKWEYFNKREFVAVLRRQSQSSGNDGALSQSEYKIAQTPPSSLTLIQ